MQSHFVQPILLSFQEFAPRNGWALLFHIADGFCRSSKGLAEKARTGPAPLTSSLPWTCKMVIGASIVQHVSYAKVGLPPPQQTHFDCDSSGTQSGPKPDVPQSRKFSIAPEDSRRPFLPYSSQLTRSWKSKTRLLNFSAS